MPCNPYVKLRATSLQPLRVAARCRRTAGPALRPVRRVPLSRSLNCDVAARQLTPRATSEVHHIPAVNILLCCPVSTSRCLCEIASCLPLAESHTSGPHRSSSPMARMRTTRRCKGAAADGTRCPRLVDRSGELRYPQARFYPTYCSECTAQYLRETHFVSTRDGKTQIAFKGNTSRACAGELT